MDFDSKQGSKESSARLGRVLVWLGQFSCCHLTVPNDPVWAGRGVDQFWDNLDLWDRVASQCDQQISFPNEVHLRPLGPWGNSAIQFYESSHVHFDERGPEPDAVAQFLSPSLAKCRPVREDRLWPLQRLLLENGLTWPDATPYDVKIIVQYFQERLAEQEDTELPRGTAEWVSTLKTLLREMPWNARLFDDYLE